MHDEPKPRWSFSLREAFLAITALGFAMGWAEERWTRPTDITVRRVIEMMSDTERFPVECRDEGPDRVRYWVVRTREKLPVYDDETSAAP